MSFYTIMFWIHILAMVVVLGGYVFLSQFWWPVLLRTTEDVKLQVHFMGQTLRRFLTTVVLALLLLLLTGGLYLLPPAYTAFIRAGDEAALVTFQWLLAIKLLAVLLVLFLVPMQLFGMALRLTRMDAGIYPYDANIVARVGKRMQVVSYLIIALLTVVVLVSTQL